jgi:integrative and conjugative element protein (TIGR02256 family)
MLRFAPRKRVHDLRVVIAEEVIEEMVAISNDRDSETGGVLIGRYAEDGRVAYVELASPPPGDSSAGLDWFERGQNGLRELLREQWNLPQRRFYVGEWHFHPIGRAEPSFQDRQQMATIAQDSNYHCERPLLIIASPSTLQRRTARVFVPNDQRELQEFKQEDPA